MKTLLSQWPYVKQTPMCGAPDVDVAAFLRANGKESTAAHCAAVARTSEELAARFGLDKTVASRAALLHDISCMLKPQDMLEYAWACGWSIDEAEQKHPFLLHQRISAAFARDVFNIDDGTILSAIECHSTLKENPGAYDMLLFIADKLSWDQKGAPPYYDAVCTALEQSLACAALAYINYALEHGMLLAPHQWLLDAKLTLQGT